MENEAYHENINYNLDDDVRASIEQLKRIFSDGIETTYQNQTTKSENFKFINHPFNEFSNSRLSVRNYSESELTIMKIQNALELARNTPSACNRQSWRTYVYANKIMIEELLEAQEGNRGFGHLANKLIIIAGEFGLFYNTFERHQVYIDGGIYAMNLLYALHFNEIAACILNCSFDYEKEQKIKSIAGIKDSEVLIAMISCGVAPDVFKFTNSPRYSLNKTNKIIT